MPPTAQIEMKKKAQAARNNEFDIVANVTGRPVERPENGVSQHRAFDGAPGQQTEKREPSQHFEIRAEDVFEPDRLRRDIIDAKPFDVRACGPGKSHVECTSKRQRGCDRQPLGRPEHKEPPHATHSHRIAACNRLISHRLPQTLATC
jgi:hypothetical protein